MELTAKHREYWRKNLLITGILLLIWFIATFIVGWYARELNQLAVIGFPARLELWHLPTGRLLREMYLTDIDEATGFGVHTKCGVGG